MIIKYPVFKILKSSKFTERDKKLQPGRCEKLVAWEDCDLRGTASTRKRHLFSSQGLSNAAFGDPNSPSNFARNSVMYSPLIKSPFAVR